MTARLIDAHCHLDRYPDPLAEALELERRGVVAVAVMNLPSHFRLAQPHLRPLRLVRPALGLHPLAAADHEGNWRSLRNSCR